MVDAIVHDAVSQQSAASHAMSCMPAHTVLSVAGIAGHAGSEPNAALHTRLHLSALMV